MGGSSTKKRLFQALTCLVCGTFLLSITYLMVELYSERQTLQAFFFQIGIGLLLLALGNFLSVLLRLGNQHSNLMLLIVSTIFVFYFAEIGLRSTGLMYTELEKGANGRYTSFLRLEKRDSWYRIHPPDTTLEYYRKEFEFQRTTNSLGLSEREISLEKNGLRIIGIGDSFTEGTGVAQDSTWLKRLERSLNAHFPELNIESVNAGIGGSDPLYGYQLLHDKLLVYEPDVVLLSINSSDIGEVAYRGGFERFHEDGTSGKSEPFWEWIYQQSHIVRLIVRNGLKFNHYLISPEKEREGRMHSVQIISDVIEKFEELAKMHDFQFMVIFHPIVQDFNQDEYLDPELTQILNWSKEQEVSVLDVRDCFKNLGIESQDQAEQFYWQIDRHFNQAGYDIYGDCVADFLGSAIAMNLQDSLPTTN